jgi:hypothetical protein
VTKTPDLGALPIDLPRLIESRMLLVAASGQGKSFALRRLIALRLRGRLTMRRLEAVWP